MVVGLPLAVTPAGAQTAVPARSAFSFVDSLGVNIHMAHNARSGEPWGRNAYNDAGQTERALTYLGAKYARDFYARANADILRRIHDDIGIKYDLFLGVGWGFEYADQMSLIRRNADMLVSVEGPNEVDNWPPTFNGLQGYAASIAEMKQIHADVKGYPATAQLPVYCLTLGDADANGHTLGDLSAWCDNATAHTYPVSGQRAYPFMAHWNSLSLRWAPDRPVVLTEGGYSTRPSMEASAEAGAHARLELNFLFDAFAQGVPRTYLYELFDEYEDGYQDNARNWHFGLFRHDGSPKPAAEAIHVLTTVLRDKAFTPGALACTVDGLPPTAHQILLQKSDGTFVLALWNEPVFDMESGSVGALAPAQVVIGLGRPAASVQVVDPLAGPAAARVTGDPRHVAVSVPDHPVLVLIRP